VPGIASEDESRSDVFT